MMDIEKELEEIFKDPLFADIKAPQRYQGRTDRLLNGFQDICDFYERNGRAPEEDAADGMEQKLAHRLKGIRSNEEKTARCRELDRFGLLAKDKEQHPGEDELDEIFNDPIFANDGGGNSGSIFDIPEYMSRRLAARKEADYIGRRRPCDDFLHFADGFSEVHAGLKSGKYRMVKFNAAHLKPGCYFVEQGVVGYLAAFDNEGKGSNGCIDGRTRVIYENGSEADIKFQTIVKNLAADGYSIENCSAMTDEELKRHFTLDGNDVESGTIYVLRSKSRLPEIAAVKNLYKIGFTTTSLASRLARARTEPTYLCADVEVVAEWRVYNVKSVALEGLVHKAFAAVQLQVTVDGHRPKEWYVVPLPVIKQALEHIVAGRPVRYDSVREVLIEE